MANVTAGDAYQFTIVCRQAGQNGINVRYFLVDSTTGLVRPKQAWLDVVSGVMADKYKPLISSAAVYRGIAMRDVSIALPELLLSTAGSGAGTAIGDPLPSQSCGLITVRGPGAARHNHGRVYIPFPSEDDNAANGGVSVSYGTRADLLGTALTGTNIYNILIPAFSVTGRWYIAPNRGTGIKTFLETFTTRGFWATQRRRSLLNRSDLVIV